MNILSRLIFFKTYFEDAVLRSIEDKFSPAEMLFKKNIF